MTQPRNSRIIWLLFLMFFYIIAQLGWWAVLITRLNQQVYAGDERLSHRISMVWGEGIVFAMILLIGFILTYKSYLKELRLARQQKNFLLSVTHEFKTPIASLRLQLETLQSRNMNEDQKKILLDSALADTDRLNALAENILIAARIDQNGFPVHRSEGNLSAFVQTLSERLAATVGNRHQTKLKIEEQIYFQFDPQAIQSIITNLYENACKYSPKGSTIEVELKKNAAEILLSVSDQGAGIAIEDGNKIFEKFFRAGNEETRSVKGAGLGLFIVRHFVLAHQGEISFQSQSGKGTTFSIRFNA